MILSRGFYWFVSNVVVANKERIARAGGIKPLIALSSSKQVGVAVEAIAALANLAVNGKRYLLSPLH